MFYGHLHPLVLHFPIALMLLVAVLEVLPALTRQQFGSGYGKAKRVVLILGAASAVVAATMGLTLASGGAYEGETVSLHKSAGISVAVLAVSSVVLAYLTQRGAAFRGLYGTALAGTVIAVFVAGHWGGNLTHGSRFLSGAAPEPLATWMGEDRLAVLKARYNNDSYAADVEPILGEHCLQCHGPDKQQGDLRLDLKDAALAGGESGWPAIEPGNPLASDVIRRLFLPRDHEEAMPPDDRPRPSDEQIVVLADWIAEGALFAGESSGAAGFLADYLGSDIEPADETAVATLRDAGAVVASLSKDNNLLSVDVSLKPLDKALLLDLLEPLSKHIAWLDLGGNSIDDDVLDMVANLQNLTRLSLENTAVDDKMIRPVSEVESLVTLNVTNTRVTADSFASLSQLPFLESVYAWNTETTPAALDAVRTALAPVKIIGGATLSLPPPEPGVNEVMEEPIDAAIDE